MSESQKKILRCWMDVLNRMQLTEQERANRVIIAVDNVLFYFN